MHKRPPNASFFSKINGKEKKVEGPYEEEYLDYLDTYLWKEEEGRLKSIAKREKKNVIGFG